MVAIEPEAKYRWHSRHVAVVHQSINVAAVTYFAHFWNTLFLYNFAVTFSVINQQNVGIRMIDYGMKSLGSYPGSRNNYIFGSGCGPAAWNPNNLLPTGKGDFYLLESG
jgi:hypothetical protein